jgi:hypothetical protein
MPKRKESPEVRLRRTLSRSKSLIVSDQNLSGIDLSKRALLGIVFRRCELAGADFLGADLSLARFIDCNLYMADFSESVLYTTWFYECNLTKAIFHKTYLLGLRFRNVDITKTEFDDIPAVGLERKSRTQQAHSDLRLPLMGILPRNAQELERICTGIGMDKLDRIITFIPASNDTGPRAKIRAAETARYLRNVHAENGYDGRAEHYYIVERRLRRQAMRGTATSGIRRAQDYVFGEILWRYGSSLLRPILALAILAMTCVIVTYFAPLGSPATGLYRQGGGPAYSFHGWDVRSALSFLNVTYFYLTAPAGGGSGAVLIGWVRVVFVAYVLLALWLLALIFDAFVRRIGTSR